MGRRDLGQQHGGAGNARVVKLHRIQKYRDAEGVDDAGYRDEPEILCMNVTDAFREAVFDGDRSCNAASVSA